MLGKIFLAFGALLAFASLAKAKGGGTNSQRVPPKFLGSATPESVPANSEPATNLGQPTTSQAQGASGRVYTVWMFPPNAAGTYTIARLAGSSLWLSFVYNAASNLRIPGKTNATDPHLSQLRSDWLLAA